MSTRRRSAWGAARPAGWFAAEHDCPHQLPRPFPPARRRTGTRRDHRAGPAPRGPRGTGIRSWALPPSTPADIGGKRSTGGKRTESSLGQPPEGAVQADPGEVGRGGCGGCSPDPGVRCIRSLRECLDCSKEVPILWRGMQASAGWAARRGFECHWGKSVTCGNTCPGVGRRGGWGLLEPSPCLPLECDACSIRREADGEGERF